MVLCRLPTYVGETGRCFEAGTKEHMRNVKSYGTGSNIAKSGWSSNHFIDFKIKLIGKDSFRIHKTIEPYFKLLSIEDWVWQPKDRNSLSSVNVFYKCLISFLLATVLLFRNNVVVAKSKSWFYKCVVNKSIRPEGDWRLNSLIASQSNNCRSIITIK